MNGNNILFFSDDVKYRIREKIKICAWLLGAVEKENKKPGAINIILCSDKKLLEINRTYLKHDFYTDVIAFDYNEKKEVAGDIFISIDRVRENAKTYKVLISEELCRVMIHGVLHLCGYKDTTARLREKMKEKEDYWLNRV